jgi:hypothetical protein
MKTFLPFINFGKYIVLITLVFANGYALQAQSGQGGGSGNLSNGLKFENYQLIGGNDLQLNAEYRFASVNDTTDAIVRIDSLINGAKVNKIDDNSNGTGYKSAFQPAVQNGNTSGLSYAVFSIRFYQKGTNTPVNLYIVNATSLDIDGNNTLKEYAKVRMGSTANMNYMSLTTDITVTKAGDEIIGQNILGLERNGIDTAFYNNMFTASNSNISSFSVAYGSVKTNNSSSVRQYSLYLKGFAYPAPSTLPVKLTAFTASLIKEKVNLKWETASEINVSHFELERSTDGVNYNQAAIVFAYGSATDKASYSYSDNVASFRQPVVYYRLRSVDIDGKTELSETRIIRINQTETNSISLQTYPNPVMNELRVTIPNNWQNKQMVFELFNANGQVSGRKTTSGSNQTETINTSSLAPGFYIVRVSCDGQTAQQKVIKH